MSEVIMYAVVKNTYRRKELKDGTLKNVSTTSESRFYTSKAKAVEFARSLANMVKPWDIQLSYKLHKDGKTQHFMDVVIKVDEYREDDGILRYGDTYYLLDTDKGCAHNASRIKDVMFFETE